MAKCNVHSVTLFFSRDIPVFLTPRVAVKGAERGEVLSCTYIKDK